MKPPTKARRLILSALALVVCTVAPTVLAVESASAAPTKLSECSFTSAHAYSQGTVLKNARSLCGTAPDISPMTSTPNGYELPKGDKRTAYIWVMRTYYAYTIRSDGHITSRVRESFKENVRGRTSNIWEITVTNKKDFGYNFFAEFDYYCGVNLSGKSDPTCDSWPDNHGDKHVAGLISNTGSGGSVKLVKNFGGRSGTKFPMFNDKIKWTNGNINISDRGQWGFHIRGYDVKDTKATTRLNNKSGDGH